MLTLTAALHLALNAVGVGNGDEVIIPTNTFIATAEAVVYSGAKPILCDVEENYHNIDINLIEQLITPRTKAIIPVHFGGNPCDMDEIKKLEFILISKLSKMQLVPYHPHIKIKKLVL